MELLVYRAEVFAVYVRVDLGSGEIGVSQHLLHGPQIGAALEQVRRETVP
jgi:hypothetical protein